MRNLSYVIFLTSIFVCLAYSETITDTRFGYTVFLPDNWMREIVSDTHHRFLDTSGTYKSIIAIIRYDFDTINIFSSPEEWTRANFLAYYLITNSDPLSYVVFYDTVTTEQNGSLYAADAFSVYYDPDTQIGDWAEYVKYTATETKGYEICALGPIDDMEMNVGFYAAIIDGFTIDVDGNNVTAPGFIKPSFRLPVLTNRTIDMLGRCLGPGTLPIASQIVVTPRNRIVDINR